MVSDDPCHPVTWHRALPILLSKWSIHIAFSHNSATNQDGRMKFGSQYVWMDFYTNLSFRVQKGRWLGSRDPISKFWDPRNNFRTNRAICFIFGTYIEDRPLRRADHRMTPKWTWPGSRSPISKWWDPLITFERIELSPSNSVRTYRTDPPCVRIIQEAQLMLTTGSTRLAVSRGQQTWYHSTCNI